MRDLCEPGLIEALSPILEEAKTRAFVIHDGTTELGAIVSMEDYEIVRRAKGNKFLSTADELGKQMLTRAAADGLKPADLMKLLDRKAS